MRTGIYEKYLHNFKNIVTFTFAMKYDIERSSFSTDEEINQLRELLISTFGTKKSSKFTQEFLKWQYSENPRGNVVSFNAWCEDGRMAGHYAAIPILMKLDGKETSGLLSLNTATHPDHQGNGLFTKLASATYDFAKENGYKFVIGVANANSTYGFINKLGFYKVAPLEVKIGIGNAFKGFSIKDRNHCAYDDITLEWRLRCPSFSYSRKGNCIWSKRKEPLFKACLAPVPEGVKTESSEIPNKGSIFGLYVGIGIKPSGLYIDLPGFIKRSPFNLIFRDLTDGELPRITPDNIVFTLMDFDVA